MGLFDNLYIVLALVYLIWIYGWAKNQLSNTLLAVLFAVLVVWLTFFQYPVLVWVPVILFFFATFFRGFLEKVPLGETKPDYLRD